MKMFLSKLLMQVEFELAFAESQKVKAEISGKTA